MSDAPAAMPVGPSAELDWREMWPGDEYEALATAVESAYMQGDHTATVRALITLFKSAPSFDFCLYWYSEILYRYARGEYPFVVEVANMLYLNLKKTYANFLNGRDEELGVNMQSAYQKLMSTFTQLGMTTSLQLALETVDQGILTTALSDVCGWIIGEKAKQFDAEVEDITQLIAQFDREVTSARNSVSRDPKGSNVLDLRDRLVALRDKLSYSFDLPGSGNNLDKPEIDRLDNLARFIGSLPIQNVERTVIVSGFVLPILERIRKLERQYQLMDAVRAARNLG